MKNRDKKIELKLEVKNFGPISDGRITLKPFTLFIGPNNSGKSYAAMLIHSIFESYSPSSLPRNLPFFIRRRFLPENIDIKFFLKEFPELKKQIDNLKGDQELAIPKEVIENIIRRIFKEIYEKGLSEEIAKSFACTPRELVMIGENSFSLRIDFNSYSAHLKLLRDKLEIEKYPQIDIGAKIKKIGLASFKMFIYDKGKEVLTTNIGFGQEIKIKSIYPFIIDAIFRLSFTIILKKSAVLCYYLPASRSGILQGHKAIVADILEKIPYVSIGGKIEVAKFSGVVFDFLSSIITLPEERGYFYKMAQDFEKEIIKGEIFVHRPEEFAYPEIKYNFKGTEIQLHRASSTVSELAPLFLYLKYIIEPGSILIIEEPEAHLHPENQRILAKFLVRLLRKGVYIIITTHSEYLLEQLSSFILLSKIQKRKRVEKYKYEEGDYIKTDEIATYVFDYDPNSGGHKVKRVEITEEDGISQKEFLKIHEALYEESIRLQKDLNVNS